MVDDCLESPIANKYSLRKKLKLPILMRALNINKEQTVLDIGCGAGIFSAEMAKVAKKAYGMDYSETNIRAVRNRYSAIKNLEFKVGDATKLPFEDNYFDAILATELIEHVEDDNAFVRECQRVLKKGGVLAVTTPCTNPTISVDWFRRLGAGIHIDRDFGHKRAGYTKKELYGILTKHGLKPVYAEYYDQLFGEIAWVITCMPRAFTNKNWKSGEGQDIINESTMFKIYKIVFPFILLFAKLDIFLKKMRGHHIIVKSVK
jgi:ubiquinone/menaquinone biosynthesis C-methylase UbiE